MTEDPSHLEPDTPPASPEPGNPVPPEPDMQNLLQDLELVPTWAKPGAGAPSFKDRGDAPAGPPRERRGRRDDRDRRGRRPPREGGKDRGERRDDRGRGRDRGPQGDAGGRGRRDNRRFDRDRPPPRPTLPIEVSFIPERNHLGSMVRQISALKRSFPLPYLAGMFLSKPELYLIKLDAAPGGDKPGKAEAPSPGSGLVFYQTSPDRQVFLNREEAVQHLVGSLLEELFETEDIVAEPPAGNFLCVGRCRRTGTLIGPPNHHAFQEGLAELQRTHYPHLSLDEVRKQVDMVREPETIEAWREAYRRQKQYRLKQAPEESAPEPKAPDAPEEASADAETPPPPDTSSPWMTRDEAVALLMKDEVGKRIHESARVVAPATALSAITDEKLRNTVWAALNRERRFPLSMMLALRPAFKRMRLHVYKAGKNETFVTAIAPKPLDAEHAIENIRQMHTLLLEHPGWTRRQLAEKIHPGEAFESEAVASFLQPLTWLIEKGHVIEYYNGALAVPGAHKLSVHQLQTGEAATELKHEPAPPEGASEQDLGPASSGGTAAPPSAEPAGEVNPEPTLPPGGTAAPPSAEPAAEPNPEPPPPSSDAEPAAEEPPAPEPVTPPTPEPTAPSPPGPEAPREPAS